MTALISGLILLIGVHLVPTVPTGRQRLMAGMGKWPYLAGFSLIALAGLFLIMLGMGSAPRIQLWTPPEWGRLVPQALMLPAFILLVAAYVPGNIKRITPHPMLWAVILWAVSHLSANGDLASMTLFLTIGLYALYAIDSANRRGAAPSVHRAPLLGDLVALLGGLLLYVLVFMNHALLFGVSAGG